MQKCYIMVELTFPKELMLRQANRKSVIFVTIGFLNKDFTFQPNACNICHDLLMSMDLSDTAISNIISGISRNEAINLMQNAGLTEKKLNIINQKNL